MVLSDATNTGWNHIVNKNQATSDKPGNFRNFQSYLRTLSYETDASLSERLEKRLEGLNGGREEEAPAADKENRGRPRRAKKKAARGRREKRDEPAPRGRSLPPPARSPTPERAARSPLPSPTRFAVERPLEWTGPLTRWAAPAERAAAPRGAAAAAAAEDDEAAEAAAAADDDDFAELAEIEHRAAALRRQMDELSRRRHRVMAKKDKRRSQSLPPKAVPPAKRAGAEATEDDLAPRRAVEVVEHVLLDVIFNEAAIEIEMDLGGYY